MSSAKEVEIRVLGHEGKGHQSEEEGDFYLVEMGENRIVTVGSETYEICSDKRPEQVEGEGNKIEEKIFKGAEVHNSSLEEALELASPNRPPQRIPTDESRSETPPRFDFGKKERTNEANCETRDTRNHQSNTERTNIIPVQTQVVKNVGPVSTKENQPNQETVVTSRIDIYGNLLPQDPKAKKRKNVEWEGRGIKFGRHFRNKMSYHYAAK